MTSGVPMIAWPHEVEQFLNCRYLVDELQVAEEILKATDGLVHQKEFERAFGVLLGEQGKAMRQRCQELKVKGAAAVAPDGSSVKALLQLVEDIKS
ncbi:hypothetical protein R1flu_027030 [Riccia fluitans]|uniref:Uncharacterized protein n=1 Tax=Riccia fluitans TaxID=41844 RepID=A0ABD1XHM9_9MARC